MVARGSSKGKKRTRDPPTALHHSDSTSSLSPAPSDPPPVKKPKRAETRPCPVCSELIPLRLMGKHLELESERVDEIIANVGSPEVYQDDREEGPSNASRRSAIRARKSFSSASARDPSDPLYQGEKAIQSIRRRRKQRHAKLKDMVREEDEDARPVRSMTAGRNEIICPVCSTTVHGDQDVLDAHVDACVANESRRIEEERQRELAQREAEEVVWQDSGDAEHIGHVGDVRGTGFHTRNEDEQDIDEEIDVDGDDAEMFGAPQFNEGDIVPVQPPQADADENVEIDIEGDDLNSDHRTLRDLIADGKVVQRSAVENAKAEMEEVMGVGDADRIDLAILAAKRKGDKKALIVALQEKVDLLESARISSSTSLLCRICLDPYNEPTVSTGCWHTCCRECWLRCLGSTKLCPICKRITAAADLRRVYL
ncbi:uncharacterized protein SCHCODRAFT_02623410 [Schizophyllum commune H4-8]|uniref:uncharacterized protein n=1 Tax=Schizophyllum commune (strain H4-8 / FGSC 9210) TaxID=578458 RepID=UPI00215FB797|nr:uncharacterized protein SCHCODRAFT_02623410 [Schizophyllum commune H4-8]KAI5894001.1 hypothetical protein SCHCODRAFT_02623410 [Schizophyllum commune H4-8]